MSSLVKTPSLIERELFTFFDVLVTMKRNNRRRFQWRAVEQVLGFQNIIPIEAKKKLYYNFRAFLKKNHLCFDVVVDRDEIFDHLKNFLTGKWLESFSVYYLLYQNARLFSRGEEKNPPSTGDLFDFVAPLEENQPSSTTTISTPTVESRRSFSEAEKKDLFQYFWKECGDQIKRDIERFDEKIKEDHRKIEERIEGMKRSLSELDVDRKIESIRLCLLELEELKKREIKEFHDEIAGTSEKFKKMYFHEMALFSNKICANFRSESDEYKRLHFQELVKLADQLQEHLKKLPKTTRHNMESDVIHLDIDEPPKLVICQEPSTFT